MPPSLQKAISLFLFAAMLASTVLLGWGTGWVSHVESHADHGIYADADLQSDDSTPSQLTDAQHQLLHEVSHHPLAILPTVAHTLRLPDLMAHQAMAHLPVPSVAIAPPLRPPRLFLSL
ncbi:hypothetical protein [Achromobacter animicus]|uniref:hypothetical protein n=1 Tax=Achromobacter animicus TaxID=1389935 RepID=UPI002448BD55|nr:hypothetical protein [Achromobacter animicus]MDH0682760.1 hypothetical protein [Achromobacter animicus]